MHLHRRGQHVVAHTPAKLNLFFEVLDRRSDGFHDVETLVYPVDLCDTLVFRKRTDEQVVFRVSVPAPAAAGDGASIGNVPADSSNLVVRALERLRERADVTCGADVLLVKRIPSEAGLGGGSSDAAAALAAANIAWGLDWQVESLAAIGSELGSDVPLFFYPRASICRGRGELVEAAQASPLLHFALFRPPVGLGTAEVYGACQVTTPRRPLVGFLDAFLSADLHRIGEALFNRLEPAAASLSSWIDRTRRIFADLDCAGSQMTGSGTCHFGLCRHARHARRVVRRLESYGVGRAYAVRGYR